MPRRHKHHHHHSHQRLTYLYLLLVIDGVKVGTFSVGEGPPEPYEERNIYMDAQVSLGHVINCELSFLDQNGNPMLTQPKPDTPPAWTQLTPAVETLVASADGLQAVLTPLTVGVDTVTANLIVAGVKFQATLNVAVTPVAQVLTSVEIKSTVV
jgi:hypothetical protein